LKTDWRKVCHLGRVFVFIYIYTYTKKKKYCISRGSARQSCGCRLTCVSPCRRCCILVRSCPFPHFTHLYI
jgi:hypothetical protein